MIYLACPYTDDDEEVRRMRVDAATPPPQASWRMAKRSSRR